MPPPREAALEEALHRISSLPVSAVKQLDQTLRQRLDSREFTGAQRKILRRLYPSAAIRMHRSGCSGAAYLTEVRSAASALALLNSNQQWIDEALDEVPRPDSEGALALDLVIRAIRLELLQTFHHIAQAEVRLVNRLWRTAAGADTADEFLQSVLIPLRAHFAAAGGSIRLPEITGEHREVAREGSAGGVSQWSVPLARATLNLVFDEERPLHPRESRLLTILSGHCALVLQRLAARTYDVSEIDRARITRELHDGPAQAMAMIQLQLEMGSPDGPPLEAAESAVLSMRNLTAGMHLPRLANEGLLAAIQNLITRLGREFGVRGRLYTDTLPELDLTLQAAIYRIVQESLSNVAKHSSANRLKVSLRCSDSVLSVCIEDNGTGFHVAQAIGGRRCFGLAGIRARVDLLGGQLTVESTQRKPEEPVSGTNSTKIGIHFPLNRGFPGTDLL